MSQFDELAKRAADDALDTVDSTMGEDWYDCLSDINQAEFWTQILLTVLRRYGSEDAAELASELESALPHSVRNMVLGNVREIFHKFSTKNKP
jgi:hypothetical protein